VTANPDDESAEYLRVLAAGLIKCGVPVEFRADADRRTYLRASHPSMPLSTDVYCVSDEAGSCSYRSEWGSRIARADDPVSAMGYVVGLLRIFPG
jgi:hypothetical protein